jgi:hypothetical protein
VAEFLEPIPGLAVLPEVHHFAHALETYQFCRAVLRL